MTLLIDDVLSGTPGQDLSTDATTTFVKITTQGLVFSSTGTVRNAGALASAYYNSAVVPPSLHRVIGVISAMGTLIAGAQAGISGRIVNGAGVSTQDRYSVIVNPTDTTGNTTKLILRAIGATGTITNLTQYNVPSWAANVDRTTVLGLGIANTQIVFLDGVPVICTFDTSVTRAGRGGVDYGNASQGAGAVGYQLTRWMVDDITDAPTWSVAPTITGTPAQGSPLTCNPGTMSGGDTTKFQWMSQDSSGTGLGYTAISGATSATFTPGLTEINKKLVCVVLRQTGATTPATMLAVGANVTAATAAIAGAPSESSPAVITAPHAPARTGEALQVQTQTAWSVTPGDTVTLYERKAQRSTDGVNFTDITGSGSPSSGSTYASLAAYVPVAADRTKVVRYAERITAAAGGVSPWSYSNALQVSGVPVIDPVTPPVIISDGTPEVGETLTIGGGWLWGPALTYQWRNNGSDITGEIGTSYIIASTDRNDSITCNIGATNSEGGPVFYETPAVVPTDPSLNDYFVVPLATTGLVGILTQRLYNLKTNQLLTGATHSGISEIFDTVYRVAVQRPAPGAYLLVVEDGSGGIYNFRYEVPVGLA